ncbi:hypothetical protein F4819DRAFT_481561 [Hypoxylon fuscum]|nr:hypothetical protein F4819DRAFT_481561 [Hypoxylon fuscum]
MCFFTRYEDSFKRDLGGNRQQDLKQEAKEEIEESTRMSNRVETLKRWINPPRWIARFEEAQDWRMPGTGGWILESEIYQNWKKFDQEIDQPPGSRVLTIQGNVDYGKTILCSTIVDDLGVYAVDADCGDSSGTLCRLLLLRQEIK